MAEEEADSKMIYLLLLTLNSVFASISYISSVTDDIL